uniref:Myb-like domain-containing protein n=1 Tax=Brassica oleracea var. oleracea TaxID=109376 RepID=A0A0D3D981_BRAOL
MRRLSLCRGKKKKPETRRRGDRAAIERRVTTGLLEGTDMEEELRDMKAHKAYISQYPISQESTVKERREWSVKEDLILIGSWLNTSKDSIVSNEQKGAAFWKRIVSNYNSSPLLLGTVPREIGQCKQRWARINDLVCKLCGCYDMALREQRSGQNENDVMKAALDIFNSDQNMKFTLEHAWRELRHDVKWCSTYMEKDKDKRKAPEVHVPEPEDRPVGVKAAKARGWSTRDEVTGCQEYKRRGHGLSTSFTDSCMFFLADVNQDKRFTGVVFISSSVVFIT